MVKIAVFDSGLGSLSIIKSIQKICKSEIIYFADQKNFPYGKKSKRQLERIIKKTIKLLEEKFSPDLIVMASNTPTLMINITTRKLIGVNPPIKEAMMLSKTKNVAILGTKSAIASKSLSKYITNSHLSKNNKVFKINVSLLVDLVESNKFMRDKSYCKKFIKNILGNEFSNKNIDVATLSSTHLSFLKNILSSEFPQIKFIDPADNVAKKILKKIGKNRAKRNTLKIFTSGNVGDFEIKLHKIGIKNRVKFLAI
jgi:glutamate racemase